MKIASITVCGCEDDIIGYTISHLQEEGVALSVVILVEPDKPTLEVMRNLKMLYGERVRLVHDPDIAAYNGRKITAMANKLHGEGYDYILPVDADELFVSLVPDKRLAEVVSSSSAPASSVHLINHYSTDRDDPNEPNPWKRACHRHVDPNPLPKNFVRFHPLMVINEGCHSISFQDGTPIRGVRVPVTIRHFTYRSPALFEKKVRRTQRSIALAIEHGPHMHTHMRVYGQILLESGPEGLADHFNRHFYFRLPSDKVFYDPAPYKLSLIHI